jgi:hypothetical protein
MNWEALGAIGEIVGAVAVVVTLGYLAVQIRQNTRSLRAAAVQEVVRSANEWSSLQVRDAKLSVIFAKGINDYSSLSAEQQAQFSHMLYVAFRNYWVAKELTDQGLIAVNASEAYEAAIRFVFQSPTMLNWLDESGPYLARELRERIRNLVATPQAAGTDGP